MSGITPLLSHLSIVVQAAANVTTSHLFQVSLAAFTWLSITNKDSAVRKNLDRAIRVTAYTALPISFFALARDKNNSEAKIITALVSLAAWGALKIRDQDEKIGDYEAKIAKGGFDVKDLTEQLEERPPSPLRVRSLVNEDGCGSDSDSGGENSPSSSPIIQRRVSIAPEIVLPNSNSGTAKTKRPSCVPSLGLTLSVPELPEVCKPQTPREEAIVDNLQKHMRDTFIKQGNDNHRLKGEVVTLTEKVEGLNAELGGKKRYIEILTSKIDSLESKTDSLESDLEKQKLNFEKQRNGWIGVKADLATQLQKANGTLNDLQRKCADYNQKLDGANRDLSNLTNFRERLLTELANAKKRDEEYQRNDQEKQKIIEDLTKELAKFDGGMTARSAGSQKAENERLDETYKVYKARNEKLEEDLTTLQNDCERLQKEAQRLRNHKEALTEQNVVLSEKFGQNIAVRQIDESLSASSKALLELQISNYEEQIESLKKDKETQADLLAQIVGDNKDLLEKWAEFIEQKLANDLHGTYVEVSLEELRAQKEELTEKYASAKSLGTSVKELQEEKAVLNQNLTEVKAMLITRGNKIEELEDQLEDLKNNLRELENAEAENTKMKKILHRQEKALLEAGKTNPHWPILEKFVVRIEKILGDTGTPEEVLNGLENSLKHYRKNWSDPEALSKRIVEVFVNNPSADKDDAKVVMTWRRHKTAVERYNTLFDQHNELLEQKELLNGKVERLERMYQNEAEIAELQKEVAEGACEKQDELVQELEKQDAMLVQREEEKKELEKQLSHIAQELEKVKQEKNALKELYDMPIENLETVLDPKISEVEEVTPPAKRENSFDKALLKLNLSSLFEGATGNSSDKTLVKLNLPSAPGTPVNSSPFPERLTKRFGDDSGNALNGNSAEFEGTFYDTDDDIK